MLLRLSAMGITLLASLHTGGPLVGQMTEQALHHERSERGATAFAQHAEAELGRLVVEATRAGWIQANFITHDTQTLAAEANAKLSAAAVHFAKEAARFNDLVLPDSVSRKLTAIKLSLTTPAPAAPELNAEVARLATTLDGMYGRGRYCASDETCLDLGQLSEIIASSRNADSLLMAWEGWRTISVPMRAPYVRFAALMNQGAQELGFEDAGEMWRSNYDMEPAAFAVEMDRLWGQVRPLYVGLHCYVRSKLGETYGTDLVKPNEPIPAHLLGNMWAQEWGNIFDLVAPPNVDPGYDLTTILQERGVDAEGMVRYGEKFFTSLGFEPLPSTFWERSLFTQPSDRDVVCHASAWDVEDSNDVRIKMCIRINASDFATVHHELGHNFYQRAYGVQPLIFRNSANDGFHEALGDAVALSTSPNYLVQIGLLDQEPAQGNDIPLLLRNALDKIAFLPFGLLVDRWRWGVFSGEIPPTEYNAAWWELRTAYQGVAAPTPRTEQQFDPGAKYHIPGNTPYSRYFLAAILQVQFHRALCEAVGFDGPLHRCSIYGSREAGDRLRAMMEMGASRPWPEALEALTGQREMDASAMLDYYAPLTAWLDEQNRGKTCGWPTA